MKKSIKIGIIVSVLIAIGLLGTFSLSTIGGDFTDTAIHFRQERSCGNSNTFQFGNLNVAYSTQIKDAKILDPEDSYKTECVAKTITIIEKGVVIFNYDSNNGGVLIDSMSNNPKYAVDLDNQVTLDNGAIYNVPDDLIRDAVFSFYTSEDTISEDAYENTVVRSGGLYYIRINDLGHTSTGSTQGSELYFNLYPESGNITMTVISDEKQIIEENKLKFSLKSEYPESISYDNVCIDLGVRGFFDVQYERICLGATGTLVPQQTKNFEIVIPESDVVEFTVRPSIENMKILPSMITTSYVRDADVERYYNNGQPIIGDFIGYWQNVSVIQFYLDEISALEGDINASTDYINSLELSEEEKLQIIENLQVSLAEKDELAQQVIEQQQQIQTLQIIASVMVILLLISVTITVFIKARRK